MMSGASPAMERCAAESHLELSRFYLAWRGPGSRQKHAESALAHARSGLQTHACIGGQVPEARSGEGG